MQQLSIFDFLEEVVETDSKYTFDLITKRDHQCKCGGILIPRWNKEQGHYDSVCAHCFSTKECFYPANMCQRCGCTTNVYQVWLYDYNAENLCEDCIRQDIGLSKFFKPSMFDESRAVVKKIMEYRYCDVLAYIPKDALSPVELGITGLGLDYDSEEYQFRSKKWSDYTYAIWSYEKCDWEKAIQIMAKHRDAGMPAKMRISLNEDFRPEHVVEYLETK